MNDTRNILLAWLCSLSSIFAALDRRDMLTIVSAVVLTVIFFTIGKTVDVLVQLCLRKRHAGEK